MLSNNPWLRRDLCYSSVARWTMIACVLLFGAVAVLQLGAQTAMAQRAVTPTPQKLRENTLGPKPDFSWLPRLRVLTDTDYPPFNYYDEDGRLAGFNIDLARAICLELSIPCDISPAEWTGLFPALQKNEADAVIASITINARTLEQADFTARYYTAPARFVGKVGTAIKSPSPDALVGRKIAVVQGTAHEAFLRAFFNKATVTPFATADEARKALQSDAVELLFGDGVSLIFWIQGSDSQKCCDFKGDSYIDPRYFGDGVGIAVRKGNLRLREVLDYALARVKASGRYEELLLRYFPLPLY